MISIRNTCILLGLGTCSALWSQTDPGPRSGTPGRRLARFRV